MSRLPALTPQKVIRALERGGFVIDRMRGSHYHLIHPDAPARIITVPYHNRDLKRSTLHSIIRRAGFTLEQFLELL